MNPDIQYKQFHWGINPSRVISWKDPLYPKGALIEIGNLCELHVKNDAGTTVLYAGDPGKPEWPDNDIVNGSHVAYDPAHPSQRIYILSHPALCHDARVTYWKPRGVQYMLADVAKAVGGRHATLDYPRIPVQLVGVLQKLAYFTEKKGDGPSIYIHRMGEDGGIEPALTVDEAGRFWLAGGSYTCPTPGITH